MRKGIAFYISIFLTVILVFVFVGETNLVAYAIEAVEDAVELKELSKNQKMKTKEGLFLQ